MLTMTKIDDIRKAFFEEGNTRGQTYTIDMSEILKGRAWASGWGAVVKGS